MSKYRSLKKSSKLRKNLKSNKSIYNKSLKNILVVKL